MPDFRPGRPLLFACALLSSLPGAGLAQTSESLSLTVYESDLALLRHSREFDLSAGENSLQLDGLSDRLLVDSLLIRHGVNASYLNVLEMIYRNDPLTPQSLLEAHIGKTVGLVRTHPLSDADQRVEARLLSIEGGPVLSVDGRIETAPPGRIVFDRLPPQLTAEPKLEVRLVSQDSGRQPVEISYLSNGFDWQADYVAELDSSGESTSLDAWAAIRNHSRLRLRQVSVQLVSGTINRIQPEARRAPKFEAARLMAADAGAPQREALGDLHLYRLPRKANIEAGETRRIALLSARQVPLENIYTVQAQTPHLYQSRYAAPEERVPVQRQVRIHNRVAHNLGQPLPAGVIRVYQRDSQGDQQLLGEDRIGHTAVDQSALLTLGEAFDLSASKIQLSFQKLPADEPNRNIYGSEYRVRLSNAREHPVNVQVIESLPGDWRIESENLPHQRRSAAEAVWMVTVPAGGEAELRYRAVVQF